jgi:hypothetical protein
MSYSSTNNPFTNASAGFSSNTDSKYTNNTNDTNNKFTNNSQKPYEPKWNTSKYKNRWEDPNYVKDLRYDMDWSN